MAHKRDAVCSECGVLAVWHVVMCRVGCVACCHM